MKIYMMNVLQLLFCVAAQALIVDLSESQWEQVEKTILQEDADRFKKNDAAFSEIYNAKNVLYPIIAKYGYNIGGIEIFA